MLNQKRKMTTQTNLHKFFQMKRVEIQESEEEEADMSGEGEQEEEEQRGEDSTTSDAGK